MRQIHLEVDSTSIVYLLRGSAKGRGNHNSLLRMVMQLLAMDWTVRITRVYREGNSMAHWMATADLQVDFGLHCFPSFPTGCLSHVIKDN